MRIDRIRITYIFGEVGQGVRETHVHSIAQADLGGTVHLPTQKKHALKKLLKELEKEHIRREPTSVEIGVVENSDALVLNMKVVFPKN